MGFELLVYLKVQMLLALQLVVDSSELLMLVLFLVV